MTFPRRAFDDASTVALYFDRSLTGNAAAECAERAIEGDPDPRRNVKRRDYASGQRAARPRACDAVKPGTCRRCGMSTEVAHASPLDCIAGLRDRLARAEK